MSKINRKKIDTILVENKVDVYTKGALYLTDMIEFSILNPDKTLGDSYNALAIKYGICSNSLFKAIKKSCVFSNFNNLSILQTVSFCTRKYYE